MTWSWLEPIPELPREPEILYAKYQPRHRQPAVCDVTRTVDFWRALQDNTPSWLGSRVMLRQAREPDLQPHVQDTTGGPA